MQKTYALPALLTQVELAEYIGKSEAWAERARWAGEGGPPFLKIGRNVRYRASDVDRWLEDSLRTSTSGDGRGGT